MDTETKDPNGARAPRAAEPRHPIRVVATRTGLTPSALRAWERRYGVVEPARSPGGQRLYSDEDVEWLSVLRRVTDAGRAIGDVAALDPAEVRRLAAEDEAADVAARAPSAVVGGAAEESPDVLGRVWGAVGRMDARTLESELSRAALEYGAVPFVERVMVPLLHAVGVRWSKGELRPAHEHLVTAVAKRVLLRLAGSGGGAATGPALVVATLSGEPHELGAMLVSATASLQGWSVTYLGPDLPAGDVAMAAEAVGARAVAVSVVDPSGGEAAARHLVALREALPAGTILLVGGQGSAAPEMAPVLARADILHPGGLPELRGVLAEVAAGA